MKNNIKIRPWIFVAIVSSVSLISFNSAFGYRRTIINETPYQLSGTITYFEGSPLCPPSSFSIAPNGGPYTVYNGCSVSSVNATVLPHHQKFNPFNLASFNSNLQNDIQGAVNLAWTVSTGGALNIGNAESVTKGNHTWTVTGPDTQFTYSINMQ